jgi:hypothetical protein
MAQFRWGGTSISPAGAQGEEEGALMRLRAEHAVWRKGKADAAAVAFAGKRGGVGGGDASSRGRQGRNIPFRSIHISAQFALEMGSTGSGPSPTRIRVGPATSPYPIELASRPGRQPNWVSFLFVSTEVALAVYPRRRTRDLRRHRRRRRNPP